jgi:hypothetical protein
MIGLMERVELVSLLETTDCVLSRDMGDAGTDPSAWRSNALCTTERKPEEGW